MRLLGFVAPSRVANRMLSMRRWVFGLVAALTVIGVPTVISLLVMWEATVSRDWSQWRPPTSAPAGGTYTAPPPPVVERSMAQVWRDFHARDEVSPIEFIYFIAIPLSLAAIAILAILLVPEVHAGGGWTTAFQRGIRLAVAALAAVLFFGGVYGIAIVANAHAVLRGSSSIQPPYVFVFPLVIVATLGAGVVWTERMARQSRDSGDRAPIPPRCERCGYDLTHVPNSGLCPECGIEASYSLTRGAARPGAAFENGTGPLTWLETIVPVLTGPSDFYRTLQMSNGLGRADRFRRWCFVLIGCGTWTWMFLCVALSQSMDWEVVAVPTMATFAVCLAGWGTQRFVAAIAASIWIVRRDFPSSDWIRKIIRYESACLLAFCMFDGAIITFGIFCFRWPGWRNTVRPLLRNIFGGLEPEPVILLTGNALLILYWLWRYRLALQNTRWANH